MAMGERANSWSNDGFRLLRCLLAALATTLVMAACFEIKRQAPPLAPELVKPPAMVSTFTPPTGVEVIAEGSGNTVVVTVINHTDKEVLVGPKFFAVRADGKTYPGDGKNVTARLLVKTLHRQEGVSGLFQFRDLTSVENQKLIFNSPDAERQIVTIKRYETRAPNYEPTEPASSPGESRRLQREQEAVRKKLLDELRKRQPTKQ